MGLARLLGRVGIGPWARVAMWGVVLHPVLVAQASTLVDTTLFAALFCGAYPPHAPRHPRAG